MANKFSSALYGQHILGGAIVGAAFQAWRDFGDSPTRPLRPGYNMPGLQPSAVAPDLSRNP